MAKKTIEEEEEETGGTGKSPVCWLWVPEEDIDFGVASVKSTDRRELTRDGTRTSIKGTTHTLEKWSESREREVSPGTESTDTKGRQGAKLNAPVNILITLTVNNDINGAPLKWSQRCHPRRAALHFLGLKPL